MEGASIIQFKSSYETNVGVGSSKTKELSVDRVRDPSRAIPLLDLYPTIGQARRD